ncbi:Inositol 2-dehydrogenase [Planctomycetes bacterium Pan216]|uniref:Inositol 2-dehydrogenase n=1 Tax=Kolteria novifilia TaxID=2527975 RepID=A0A518BAP7_9BACT|nr:Inositol 2-dehydrogenase [Planctomycetes bacterium Pan216]
MSRQFTRRHFLKTSAIAATASQVTWGGIVRGDNASPNDKLNIAIIGPHNRGHSNLVGVQHENIVGICDVDANFLEKEAAPFPDAKRYRDFRKMLDELEPKIDAVVVSTTDHVHAPATVMAMNMGKHVYCEKPLTHTVAEARLVAELAKKTGLATQMGTQIHATDNYRRVVELIQSGAIGPVRDVHVLMGKNRWRDGRFNTGKPVPSQLDWELWLGPATKRPYTDNVHPANWRSFWDYGMGVLGDMGCHLIDLVQWSLDLGRPSVVWAEGPAPHAVGCPAYVEAHWEFPARGSLPPVTLNWYDGGRQPAVAKQFKNADGSPIKFGNGVLFVGDDGYLFADYGKRMLLPVEKFGSFTPPQPSIPKSVGHHQEWINACKTGSPTTCNFDYAGRLTETVLLGTVAYRTGKKLEWDAEKLTATNAPEARDFLTKEYRKGWILG